MQKVKTKLNIPLKECIVCSILIPRNTKSGDKRISTKQYVKAKFCSLVCKGIWQSKNNIGTNNKNYRGGNDNCIDCNKGLKYRYCREYKTRCRDCYKKFAIGENASGYKGAKGFPLCINCNGKTGDTKSILCLKCCRGKFRKAWKGGVSALNSLIRALPENRQWQKQCFYKDEYKCQECYVESKGNNLQIHHIKQFALIIKENNIKTLEEAKKCDELWDTDNGQVLCRECHKLTDNYNKKVNI